MSPATPNLTNLLGHNTGFSSRLGDSPGCDCTKRTGAIAQTAGFEIVVRRSFYVLLMWLVATPTLASAQSVWSMEPYQIKVWLALQGTPEIQSFGTDRIARSIVRHSESTFGAAWNLTITDAPPSVAQALASDVTWPTFAKLAALDSSIEESDKLFLVGASQSNGAVQIQIRELDMRTRQWRTVRTQLVRQTNRIDADVAAAVVDSFTPIGLVGRSKDDKAKVTMKAGLLTGNADIDRILPATGSILAAVTRRTDRLGKIVENGLQSVPWTLLQVESRDPRLGEIECRVISGLRNPFRTRTSRQVERIAMVIQPSFASSTLRLHQKGDQSLSLAGYDVHYRLPDEKKTTFIGRTDWRGQIDVPRDNHAVKIMYVKNGGRILARLPIVPGYQQQVTAQLVDDSRRLEAEGFLKGIQEQMVEITARRRVLALRIRKAIADKRLEKADELLDEMRSLATRDDLNRKMRDRQQSFSSDNRAIQDRIDRMFRATREILLKADQKEKEVEPPVNLDTLRSELSRAK